MEQVPRPVLNAWLRNCGRFACNWLYRGGMARRLGDIPTAQPGHVSELEGGRREPSLFYLLAIARLTGIPMEILMDDDLGLPNRLTEHALRMRPLK